MPNDVIHQRAIDRIKKLKKYGDHVVIADIVGCNEQTVRNTVVVPPKTKTQLKIFHEFLKLIRERQDNPNELADLMPAD